jgi:hypothetical protein
MNTKARVAAVTAALVLVAGCNSLHRRDKPLRDPVQLPGAPRLEPGPPASTVPSMTGPMPSPMSMTTPEPQTSGR